MLMYPNKTGKIRNDPGGMGFYGARRTKTVNGRVIRYRHRGVDYSVQPGQEVISPVTCQVIREARPYSKAPYSGLYLRAIRGEFKIFYIQPLEGLIGQTVKQGEVIGHAQDISKRYEHLGVTPHIHLEVVRLDPEVLMVGVR